MDRSRGCLADVQVMDRIRGNSKYSIVAEEGGMMDRSREKRQKQRMDRSKER